MITKAYMFHVQSHSDKPPTFVHVVSSALWHSRYVCTWWLCGGGVLSWLTSLWDLSLPWVCCYQHAIYLSTWPQSTVQRVYQFGCLAFLHFENGWWLGVDHTKPSTFSECSGWLMQTDDTAHFLDNHCWKDFAGWFCQSALPDVGVFLSQSAPFFHCVVWVQT